MTCSDLCCDQFPPVLGIDCGWREECYQEPKRRGGVGGRHTCAGAVVISYVGNGGGGEKWSCSEYILKYKPILVRIGYGARERRQEWLYKRFGLGNLTNVVFSLIWGRPGVGTGHVKFGTLNMTYTELLFDILLEVGSWIYPTSQELKERSGLGEKSGHPQHTNGI